MLEPRLVARRTLLLMVLLGSCALAATAPAHGAVFAVDRTDDALASACTTAAGDCSLRGAVLAANGAPGSDRVEVPPGSYALSLPGAGEDLGASGDLDVLEDLEIVGTGAQASDATISGASLDRILHQHAGALTLRLLTLRHGATALDGGGVFHFAGDLQLNSVTIADNEAGVGDGGGVFSFPQGGAERRARNSVIATNRDPGGEAPDCASPNTFASLGHNLVGIRDGCSFAALGSDVVGSSRAAVDPALAPLGFNGGSLLHLTHALLPESPARDGGNPAGCVGADDTTVLALDQRGLPRSVDGDGDGAATCDIGAVEEGLGAGGPAAEIPTLSPSAFLLLALGLAAAGAACAAKARG